MEGMIGIGAGVLLILLVELIAKNSRDYVVVKTTLLVVLMILTLIAWGLIE